MSFRLVPNSVTLDDLQRRNSRNGILISPNSVAFADDYVKWSKVHQYFLEKCRPRNLGFIDISFMAILAGHHPKRER